MGNNISKADKNVDGAKAIYAELCRAHDGIADFRAKLLALLPIASGAGIFLLLNKDLTDFHKFLPAVGVFGVLVTFGLFLYELRGIHRCNSLSRCGIALEKKLLGEASHIGAFSGEPHAAFGFVGNTWAALIIYPTIISGWVYVALVGAKSTLEIPGSVAALCAFLFFGVVTTMRQERM